MKSLVLALAFVAVYLVVAAMGQFNINQQFTITVVGTFRQDVPGYGCEFCDCTAYDLGYNNGPNCSLWFDAITCNDTRGPDDNQQRWGQPTNTSAPFCYQKSGVGFQGVAGVSVIANSENSTRIGAMTHYNNPIFPPSPTRLQLLINMTAPELAEPFITQFPLTFFESPNENFVNQCDNSIQRTSTPCDDRFSFNAYTITQSFLSNNIRYTLVITGFVQPSLGSFVPITQFVTQEGFSSVADVYARIVTFCETIECNVNYVFQGAPTCGCVCALTNATCSTIFGDLVYADNTTCTCACGLDPSSCNASDPLDAFNADTCSCGCNITTAYCKTVNPLFEASFQPDTCQCACNRQAFIDCRAINTFYQPQGDLCKCACAVSDKICKGLFGGKYKADFKKCGCVVPGSDTGLSNGDIAGIVVASVVGPFLIVLLVLIVAGVLAYLILAGYIPGIYGHKIAAGSFAHGGNSPMYADPWKSNSNAAA